MKSYYLNKFYEDVKRLKEVEKKFLKSKNINIKDEIYYEEFLYNDSNPYDVNENIYFENPKILTNVSVVHFTDSSPSELVSIIKNEPDKFKGLPSLDIGLTAGIFGEHYDVGPLAFGFLQNKAPRTSEYGRHKIKLLAKEAVEVYHRNDQQNQIIWDVNFVEAVKPLSKYKKDFFIIYLRENSDHVKIPKIYETKIDRWKDELRVYVGNDNIDYVEELIKKIGSENIEQVNLQRHDGNLIENYL